MPPNFANLLKELLLNKQKLEELANNIKALSVKNAEETIVNYLV